MPWLSFWRFQRSGRLYLQTFLILVRKVYQFTHLFDLFRIYLMQVSTIHCLLSNLASKLIHLTSQHHDLEFLVAYLFNWPMLSHVRSSQYAMGHFEIEDLYSGLDSISITDLDYQLFSSQILSSLMELH